MMMANQAQAQRGDALWRPPTLGQPFGVQWYWLDTFVFTMKTDRDQQKQLINQLEAQAVDLHDPVFNQVVQLNGYRMALKDDSLQQEIIQQVDDWVGAQSGPDVDAIQAVSFQIAAHHLWIHQQYSAGLERYIRAYRLYRKMDPARFPIKSIYLYDYASQYYHFRDFRTVKDLLLEMWQTIPEAYVENQTTSLNTLGLCYGQLAQYDSSQYYFEKAVHSATIDQSKVWIGIVQGNISMNLIQQGRYEEAVPMLEANIASSRQRKAMTDLAFALVGLGEIRLKQDRPEEALQLIQEGYDILEAKDKLQSYPFQARVFVPLGKALMVNGRAEEAFSFLDAGRIARDSVEAQRNALFLSGVQHKLETEQHLAAIQQRETKLREQRLMMWGLLIILLGTAAFTFVFFRQKRKIANEKKRSDDLLLNILPEEVARDLKKEGKVKARHYENVTILFTDFKDFTRIAEQMTADELVRDLDHYFRRFDEITSQFGLEKIKTIGDAYMAASGLPVEKGNHAIDAVSAALALRNMILEEQQKRVLENRSWFDIRIGLHSGPVVAGVIGLRKFSYDIWGDTVNIAARMESSGEAGKVNISEATCALVKDQFDCQFRGQIPAKNKGEIGMYFVEAMQDE
ncbi:MAG: tetratricopeptide repeat protein [Saprospiraceae bacterium]|nr:tetratricopeptide repeat protein [Saprospiraceae bacterium]